MADSDLSNNPNPYANGSPRVDLRDETNSDFGGWNYRDGSPDVYWQNDAVDPNNPYATQPPDAYGEGSSYAARNLDAVYAAQNDIFNYDTAPTLNEYRRDEGLDDQFIPIDQRQ